MKITKQKEYLLWEWVMAIRLVAADMDGTLLNSAGQLPDGLEMMVRDLRRRGIRFAVASGRQYYNLLRRFESLAEDLLFICENGAMVCDGRELLRVESIASADYEDAVRLGRSLPGIRVVLCGAQSAYIEEDEPAFRAEVALYYERCRLVSDVLEAGGQDRVCKIAFFHAQDAERAGYAVLRRLEGRLKVSVSGRKWVDAMPPGVHKGRAIRVLQEQFGWGREECMAFGDYLNDAEMMNECAYSYAMANAHADLKRICRFQAPSNDENGVMRVLNEFFNGVKQP